jgi:hypothetical protein
MPRIKVDLDDVQMFGNTIGPGVHRGKVVDVLDDPSSSGNDMVTWEWEAIEGEYKGSTIRSYSSLLEKALGNFKMHMEALGYSGLIDVDTSSPKFKKMVVGKVAILKVRNHKYRNKDGEEVEGPQVFSVVADTGETMGAKSSSKTSGGKSKGDRELPF